MQLSIANRVSLAIGLLIFLFFVTSAVSYLLTQRIEDDVAHLTGVDDPRQSAALAMEVQLAEMARTIHAYAFDRRVVDKERARRSEAGLERSATTFMRLATTAEERTLGELVLGHLEKFKKLGAEIIAATDRQSAELAPFRAKMEKIRDSVEDMIRRSIDRPDAGTRDKLEAALGIDAHIDTTIGALDAYLVSRDPGARDKAGVSKAAFDRIADRYRSTGLSGEEQTWLGKLSDNFAVVIKARDGILTLVDRKRDLLTKFETQRQRMVGLLGAQIVPLIRTAQTQAQRDVNFSTSTAILFLVVMTGFGVVVGGGTAVLLTRGIVRPMVELKASAEAIGRGRLDHRISVKSNDEIGQLAASFNRMAESRQRSEEALRELAQHDALTSLPNRTLFHRRLVEAMDNARRVNRLVAVHFLDLDHFKDINDTLGHPSGDALLRQVAQRLERCVRKSDVVARLDANTVARMGGDEFAIVQTNLLHYDGIVVLAKRLVDTISKPFDLDGERVYTGTSIGITVFPYDGREAEMLLKNADLALYRAKQEGRNKYQLYDPKMNAEIQARKALEQDIRQALEMGEFFLNYQPQIELGSGRIVGAEALVRWRHPERGMVPPGEFITVAEQSGLITNLTEGVLRDACKQAKAWQEARLPRLRVSVNLSPIDFKRKDLVPMVTGIIEDTGVDPKRLELEITEGMVMTGVESVIATLQELHALGVELAIDDFGTGYSSMNYLKQFPVDRLKIDQSFVRDILANDEDASITEAIINLGHSLGLRVIAEGVETEEQLEFLRSRGCDEAQGYCFSRPLGADEFAKLVSDHVAGEALVAAEIA